VTVTLNNQAFQLNDSTTVRVTWDNAALARLETPPGGMVVRDLIRRGNRVAEAARKQIRLGHVGTRGPAARGGRLNLRDTIHVRLVRGASSDPVLLVGSENPIALIHHEGTRPHVILPTRGKHLVFWSQNAGGWSGVVGQRIGGVVYARRVMHPGTRPNRYLTDNLHLATQ
jgi:hypothetical protein